MASFDQSPFSGQVAYPVKDPFHLPRSLMLQIELMGQMEEEISADKSIASPLGLVS